APDFSAAHELEALIHLETDDPEAAVAAAECAMQSDKASPRAWYARGIARLEMQQVELSVDDLEVACRMAPHEMRQRYALARARLAGGETEGALSELDTLLGSHPHSSDALVFRGFLHIALGNSDLAGRDFQRASELSPRLVSALYGLAVVKRTAGEFPAALQLLDAALQIDPTDEGCLLDRARLLATKDDLNAATRDLDTVLENAPDFLPALLSRA
ncbi:MAG: tetratricopeptide repeat protein, partial [Planctomyces sp.]